MSITAWFAIVAGGAIVAVILAAGRFIAIAKASLPELDGNRVVDGLAPGESVLIETDAHGVPRIIAETQELATFGLGYAHARDRYFQMDLARRFAAGELAELLGGAQPIVDMDKSTRRHRFRALSESIVARLDSKQKGILDHYVAGVNQGLKDLCRKPWEYSLLKCEPRPWTGADSLLVSYSIYLALEGGDQAYHQANALMQEVLPSELLALLLPQGSQWDSPIEGEPFPSPAVPGPDVVDLRKYPKDQDLEAPDRWEDMEQKVVGSNSWAVAGSKANPGGVGPALVANDMHLALGLPAVWYKASVVTNSADGKSPHECHGVTLPGGPAVIAGSNGCISWGLTSAQGDWGDLLTLELDPADPRRYRTPDGWKTLTAHDETIQVRGGPDIVQRYDWTIWGPVVDADLAGRLRVWRWVAHDLEGVNLKVGSIPLCESVDEALTTAATCGVPHVNFVVGDREGHIGWTIMGRIPRRMGLGAVDERFPMPAAEVGSQWDGFLTPEEYPRVVDPADGLIWTANNRLVDGDELSKIGRGKYDRGVRAFRIRELLGGLDHFDEQAMSAIQMDNRSQLALRWRDLILTELPDEITLADNNRTTFRNRLRSFDGRADAESIAFALVHQCRMRIILKILGPLTEPLRNATTDAGARRFSLRYVSLEAPAWAILQERPSHLLAPRHKSWSGLILEAVDETIADTVATGWPAWGEINTLRLIHPFVRKMPFAKPWLAAPAIRSSGALTDMPKIQTPEFGASQRMAVFPGREARGYMQLPGGQSGHPMSPHYLDLLDDWIHGRPTPLAAGEAVSRLKLTGSKSR
jgi:penicillin amidase